MTGPLAPLPAVQPGCRLIDRLAQPQDRMLQVLLDDGTSGIVILDRQARVVRVNQALRRMVDGACDLSAGSDALSIFSPLRRVDTREEITSVLMDLRPPRTFISMVTGDATTAGYTVEVSVVPLREEDGQVSGAVLHLADISIQMRLQAQLAHGQKLQAVGQFTSGIAHDFNNLLMAITAATDDLLGRPTLDAESEADLQQIRGAGERGKSLIRQLLAFGKPQPSQVEVLAVNDAIAGLSRLLVRLLGGAVKLELDLPGPSLKICVDPAALDQVIMNLVLNARNAMPGGGTVTVRTGQADSAGFLGQAEAEIPGGRYATIDVGDTGTGIAKNLLPRIFDPFFTTRGDQGGSGLGLSTVDAIVRSFRGFLRVDSQPDGGTHVCIYLPCHEAVLSSPGPPTAPATDPPRAGRRTVLLVDDEEGVCRVAARALTTQGWHVLCADSGESAIALLTGDPEAAAALYAVVTDLMLPGLDGVALVQAIRRMRPGLPAILTSGYGETAIGTALGGGDIRFLSKPYVLKALVAALEGCVRSDTRPAED